MTEYPYCKDTGYAHTRKQKKEGRRRFLVQAINPCWRNESANPQRPYFPTASSFPAFCFAKGRPKTVDCDHAWIQQHRGSLCLHAYLFYLFSAIGLNQNLGKPHQQEAPACYSNCTCHSRKSLSWTFLLRLTLERLWKNFLKNVSRNLVTCSGPWDCTP